MLFDKITCEHRYLHVGTVIDTYDKICYVDASIMNFKFKCVNIMQNSWMVYINLTSKTILSVQSILQVGELFDSKWINQELKGHSCSWPAIREGQRSLLFPPTWQGSPPSSSSGQVTSPALPLSTTVIYCGVKATHDRRKRLGREPHLLPSHLMWTSFHLWSIGVSGMDLL